MKSHVAVSLWLVFAAGSAMAGEPSYVAECKAAATAKMARQATARGLTLVQGSVVVTNIDDRFLNPYKYVWFKAVAIDSTGAETKLTTLTQKSYLPPKPCF